MASNRYAQCPAIATCMTRMQSQQHYKLTCDLLCSIKSKTTNYLLLQVYYLCFGLVNYITKLKPTIDPVKHHYIKAEVITQFYKKNRMIFENAWNALMRIGGKLYPS